MKLEITTKGVLYDKCENMEELYDDYYFPLLVEFKELQKQNTELKDNWNKLKEWMQKELVDSKSTSGYSFYLKSWLDKMQEIEGGMNE